MASGINLYEASYQWAERPRDERFPSIAAMGQQCKQYADSAVSMYNHIHELVIKPHAHDLSVMGQTGREATITHYAFGQLSRLADAPAAYLRKLPTSLAADCLNTGLAKRATTQDDRLNLLVHKNGGLVVRAFTTDKYDRVWNWQICQQIETQLLTRGWRVPPARPCSKNTEDARPATAEDVLSSNAHGLSIRVGDPIAPAGCYASDHDMFVFLVNESEPIDDGKGGVLYRGVFIKNSEVGDGAIWFITFLYKLVCGNHIVWDVEDVRKVRVAHKKAAGAKGGTLQRATWEWSDTLKALPSSLVLASHIKNARARVLGDDEEDTIDAVYKWAKGHNLNRLSQGTLTDGYAAAERHVDWYGSPRTVWGMVNGLTQLSQATSYADERNELDRQAGRLMEMAF